MRQQEIHWQNAKFNAVTLQKNTGEAPIIGEGLKQLAAQVRQVGMTDAAVLFYGETGTGKDVFARQLHLFSQRKGPFVAVHPACTPEQLFESEFFGHERGAFTGATSQKIGYVEMADGGTLFIDEVGEMPLSMQVKLLRVLQNQRFMRVGGTAEIVSRFRLVAATNRNLRDEVAKGRFREESRFTASPWCPCGFPRCGNAAKTSSGLRRRSWKPIASVTAGRPFSLRVRNGPAS